MSHNPTIDLGNLKPPKISSSTIRWIAIGVVVLILLTTTFFTVDQDEVGVILQFGKYSRIADPGLNFKLPFGIETVTKVPVKRQLKLEFGFRTLEPGVRTQYARSGFQQESLMLTGDLNAAEVEWIVQYRITDPYKYLYRVRNSEKTFRDMNEAVMREIIGDRTVNEVLTIGRVEIEDAVKVMLQDMCNQYETGIRVEQLVLQDVTPPDPVKPAFNEVNEAQQEREKLINQARSEYNRVIPRATGEAERTIEEAQGYALERVNRARGESSKFDSIFKEYVKAKEVTRRRIYLETMDQIMQKIGKKIITDEKTTGILPLFQLDKDGGAK